MARGCCHPPGISTLALLSDPATHSSCCHSHRCPPWLGLQAGGVRRVTLADSVRFAFDSKYGLDRVEELAQLLIHFRQGGGTIWPRLMTGPAPLSTPLSGSLWQSIALRATLAQCVIQNLLPRLLQLAALARTLTYSLTTSIPIPHHGPLCPAPPRVWGSCSLPEAVLARLKAGVAASGRRRRGLLEVGPAQRACALALQPSHCLGINTQPPIPIELT